MDAFVSEQAAILDFENRVRLASVAANEPFLFYTNVGKEHYTGVMAWSLSGMQKAIQSVSVKSAEFHNNRGDFEEWAEKSLHDKILAERLRKTGSSKLKGEQLKKTLAEAFEDRFNELKTEVQNTTQYF
jgi:hypothetical protein